MNREEAGFLRTPGRKLSSSSCPAVKDIFGKLRNDLSTLITKRNSKKAHRSGPSAAEPTSEPTSERMLMNGVLSHSNLCGDPVGNDIPSFDHTVAQADIENISSACEGEIDLNLRDVGERWGDRYSDEENQTSGDDGELDDAIRCQDKALAVVPFVELLLWNRVILIEVRKMQNH